MDMIKKNELVIVIDKKFKLIYRNYNRVLICYYDYKMKKI
jgi:hypothetical protein